MATVSISPTLIHPDLSYACSKTTHWSPRDPAPPCASAHTPTRYWLFEYPPGNAARRLHGNRHTQVQSVQHRDHTPAAGIVWQKTAGLTKCARRLRRCTPGLLPRSKLHWLPEGSPER